MARLSWSIPLPGPFRVSGGRAKPSHAGADLARLLEQRAAQRGIRAERDARTRNDLADKAARLLPGAPPAEHAKVEAEIVKLAALPLGSRRAELRAGSVGYLLQRLERTK